MEVVADGSDASVFGDSGSGDPSEPELVLCMERVENVVQVCYYNGPSITRYRYRWIARLREARTGRLLAEERVEGDRPRACGFSEPYSLTVISGSHSHYSSALSDMRPRLAPWLTHQPGDSALPAAPPRARVTGRGAVPKAPGTGRKK
jgi:hypothetical protein